MLESAFEFEFEKAVDELNANHDEAINLLKQAVVALNLVRVFIEKAENKVAEMPEGDRIGSLLIDTDDLEEAINSQVKRMGGTV